MFRKESYVGTDPMVLEKAVHYFYSGSALVQEFSEDLPGEEHELDIEFDYLRGADGQVVRHRNPDEAEPDRLHFNDPQGTIKEQGRPERPDGSPESYVMTAEGEPMQTTGMDNPSNIRFHGGYLEGKEFNADADTDRGHLYRMGIRHYSPALGRFLQREPLVNFRTPNSMHPLGANPYLYGYNCPTEFADPSGYQSCGGGCGNGQIGLGEGLPSPGGQPGQVQ
ncbi:MAG: RHS repeat-associated core domain-containing protein, partial [bacterium]